jgi:hypothetical protein
MALKLLWAIDPKIYTLFKLLTTATLMGYIYGLLY